MTIGERGQVTIPKELRDKLGLKPRSKVEFHIVDGVLVLRKAGKGPDFAKWKGRCADSLKRLGFRSSEEFLQAARGRR